MASVYVPPEMPEGDSGDEEVAGDVPENLECAICRNAMRCAVTTSCGHSFCGVCVHQYWSSTRGPRLCPVDRTPVTMVVPSYTIRSLVEDYWKKQGGGPRRERSCGSVDAQLARMNAEVLHAQQPSYADQVRTNWHTLNHMQHVTVGQIILALVVLATLAYLMVPLDVVPDMIFPVGLVDDVLLAFMCFNWAAMLYRSYVGLRGHE